MWNPLSWAMEAAAIIAIALLVSSHQGPASVGARGGATHQPCSAALGPSPAQALPNPTGWLRTCLATALAWCPLRCSVWGTWHPGSLRVRLTRNCGHVPAGLKHKFLIHNPPSVPAQDYADFALILALLLVNATISYVEEANADKAIKALTSGGWPGAGERAWGAGAVWSGGWVGGLGGAAPPGCECSARGG